MKTLHLAVLLATTTATSSAAGITAKDALRTLARERGASWLNSIIQVSGDQGTHQPGAWHIVAVDGRGGLREFFVGPKGIMSEGAVPSGVVANVNGPIVPQKQFTADSSTAFTRANTAAKSARIGFDSADYRLRSSGPSTAPVWYIQLNNASGQKVADVTLSGSNGRVLQMLAYNPPVAPTAATASAGSSGNQAWGRTKETVNRGAVSVGRGISRAGQWISQKFSPSPSSPPPPAYNPPR